MEKDYNSMSSQEVEDEILLVQKYLGQQEEQLGLVQLAISTNRKELIDLKDGERKAEQNIKDTNIKLKNLEKIFKWRAIKKENNYR